MPTLKKRVSFFESEEGRQAQRALIVMAADSTYFTEPSYSANTMQYPNNLMPFVEKHMNYLNAHPSIDTEQYVSNLRLMTRIR